VFGSSEPLPGDPLYELARRLGEALARAGFRVVTGGYGGVMEAASRGASDAGGTAIGVVSALFGAREPNRYLSEVVRTRDLFDRTRELVARADAYVVLPGKAGTLAELAWLWALDRAGCLGRRPVIVLGDVWSAVLAALEKNGLLEPSQILRTSRARTPEEAVRLVQAPRSGPGDGDE
jgi:uncharacterized protein (TIGR00730 family)